MSQLKTFFVQNPHQRLKHFNSSVVPRCCFCREFLTHLLRFVLLKESSCRANPRDDGMFARELGMPVLVGVAYRPLLEGWAPQHPLNMGSEGHGDIAWTGSLAPSP